MAYATRDQIAALLKCTPRMVNLYVRNDGLPQVERGQYDVVAVVHWLIDFKDRQIAEAGRGGEDAGIATARLLRAKADLAEYKVQLQKGELLRRDEVTTAWGRVLSAVRTKFLGLPTKAAPRVLTCENVNDVKRILDNEVRMILDELSNQRVDVSDVRPAGSGGSQPLAPKSPSPSQRKRMGGYGTVSQPRVQRRAGEMADNPG